MKNPNIKVLHTLATAIASISILLNLPHSLFLASVDCMFNCFLNIDIQLIRLSLYYCLAFKDHNIAFK